VLAGQVMAIPTVATSDLGRVHISAMLLLGAADVPLAIAALVMPWDRWSRRWLLCWPLWVMLSLAAAGRFAFADGAASLGGFFTLVFVYIGMTQSRWVSSAVLPIALPCWIATYGTLNRDLWLRLPVAVGIWVLIGETLATTQRQMRELTRGRAHDASTDQLTGLDNRRELGPKLAGLADGDALLLLDVDHFKTVNDRFGHAGGDKVLSDLGATIRTVIRPGDSAVRFGGEEMLLVLPGAHNGGALKVVRRLHDRWAQLQPGITFSAGIAVVSTNIPPQDALAAADASLYQAKRAGRDCWRFAADTGELALT